MLDKVGVRGRGGVWTFGQDLGGFLFRNTLDLLEHSARPV